MEYDYILERMTAQEFQELIQALMEAEYGVDCAPFPLQGPDGGRDIVIRNNLNPYENGEMWIQAKYKSANMQRNTDWICSQVKQELRKITRQAENGKILLPYAWICYTNISISGMAQRGAYDRLQNMFLGFRDKIPKLEVFGKEKVFALLRNHPEVARSFSGTLYPEIKNHTESKRVVAIWPSTLTQYCHSVEAEEILKKFIDQQKQPIFVTGFGGIGKSEFATHVIPNAWPDHAYRVVFEKDLLHTIASVEIDGLKRTDARGKPKTPEVLFQECMEILRVELNEKDIFVIDNYDVIDPFEDPNFTKVCSLKAHVVFVGRTAPIEYLDRTVYINPLPEGDLLSIMKFFYHGAGRDEELLDLIRLVERHTLTVELMARLLQASRGTLTPIQLKEKLRNNNLNLSSTHVRSDKDRGTPGHQSYDEVQGHLHALFVIAQLTLEQQRIMSAAGLLPVRGMQMPLFYDFLALHDMTAMDQLLELGWLRCDERNNVVSVHPLIALLCNHSALTKPSVDHCYTFLKSFSKYLRRPPTICDNGFSASLAQNILTYAKGDSERMEYIEFQDNYGYFQFLSGNYLESENNILSSIEALWKKGQYAKAVPVCIDYAMTLEIQRKMELEASFLHDLEELPEFQAVYQKEPQLYFEVLVIWGTWLRVQSRQRQAIDRLEQAEELLKKGKTKMFRQQMVAQLYYELSTCKYQIRKEVPGYLEQAEEAARKSIRYREAQYGQNDVSLANDYNTLGYIYKEKGDYNKAEKYQKMGYKLRLKYYGHQNVYTCNALENWAMTLSFQPARQDEAETKFLESLAIKKEILPANNAWIANTYWQLAKHYQRTCEWQKAIDCCAQALQIYKGQEGKFWFSIGLMLYEQARSYYEMGAYEDALDIAQKAYDMQYKDPLQGPEKPSTKDTEKLLQDINQCMKTKEAQRTATV